VWGVSADKFGRKKVQNLLVCIYMTVTCVCVGSTSCTNSGIPVWHSQCLLTKLLCVVAAQRDGWVCYGWRISWVSLNSECALLAIKKMLLA